MRLHQLAVEAFGPFPERVVVPFDDLADHGLFLVHGPTGSGKTSLLDAICYALYGTVPGARQEAKTLRCHHASPDAVPRVELELTAAGRRLRIARSPEFHRPRKRGAGLTKVPAKALLAELVDGVWVDRGSGRQQDVADILRDVLGLDAAQFQTVVLLPQGQFASFLRADTSERVAVLARLFDTQRFDAIVSWLEARRRQADDQVSAVESELRVALARAAQARAAAPPAALPLAATGTDGATVIGPPLPSPAPDAALTPDDPDALRALLHESHQDLLEQARGLAALARASETRLASARRRSEHGQALARMRDKAQRAQATLDTLDAQRPLVLEARARLDAAARSTAVSGHLSALDAARSALSTARRPVDELPEPLRDVDAAHRLSETLHAQDDAMVALAGTARRLARADAAHAEATQEVDLLQGQLTRAQDAARQAVAVRDDTAREQAIVAGIGAQLPTARASEIALERCAQDADALATAAQAHSGLVDGIQRLQVAAEAAQRRLAAVLRARADGLAAELASGLLDGHPCPVCGSATHPAPARSAGSVSAEECAVAETEHDTARRSLADGEARLAAAAATLAERQARLETSLADAARHAPHDVDDLRDSSLLRATLDAARELRAECEQAAMRTQTLAERSTRLEALAAAAQDDVAVARERVVAAQARLEAARSLADRTRDDLDSLLDAHRGCPCTTLATDAAPRGPATNEAGAGDPTVVAARHVHAVELAAAAGARHAALETATAHLSQAQDRLERVLHDLAFPDETAARGALLAPDEAARLADIVTDHAERTAGASALLQQEDIIAALAEDEPDVTALLDLEQSAGQQARDTREQATLARHAVQAHDAARSQVEEALDLLGPALREATLVREVADVAAGSGANNTLRMSLTTFVLAARLEEVVQLANERLTVMTHGRYELRHTDSLAARGKRSGLGLEVVDAWSGTSRDTKTLSGGETFMASLALALGLGDAVRAESGGIDLQTLFVDEGFGTLDDEALEQVMTVLDGLRSGGRCVGIVSHVADLRQRIPAQVRLVRTESGSRLTTTAESELE